LARLATFWELFVMAKRDQEPSDLDYGKFADGDLENAKKFEKPAQPKAWADQGKQSKTLALVVTFLAMLVMAGIIGAYLLMGSTTPEAFLITVPIEDYDQTWPVNPWASQDSLLLANCFRRTKTGDNSSLANVANEYQNAEKFRLLLRWIAGDLQTQDPNLKADFAARPLVLHISALGTTVRDVPYIIPIGSDRSDPWRWSQDQPSWISVEEVIKAVEKCKAPKKLLLLDLAHPCQDGFLGPLRNDLSKELHNLLNQLDTSKKLTFPVIVSTSSGQQSWPNDKWQCSAFAFYLAEGLHGLADGYADGQKNQRITVAELAKFVTPRVARFSKSVYGENQVPMGYGLDSARADFTLTFPNKQPESEAPTRPEYPELLDQWWRAREVSPNLNWYDPIRVNRLTGALSRWEQYWFRASDRTVERGRTEIQEKAAAYWREKTAGGTYVADPFTAKQKELLALTAEYRLGVEPPALPKPSKDAPEPKAGLDPFLQALANPTTKPDELDKLRPGWDAKVSTNPKVSGSELWDFSRKVTWTEQVAQQLAKASKAITNPGGQTGYQTFELLLLQRIARWDIRGERQIRIFPSDDVRQLLELEHELSQVLKAGPEGFAIIKNDLLEAEALRNQAQQGYFKPGRGDLQIQEPIRQARAKYLQAKLTLEKWREANRVLRELTAAIHDTAPAVVQSAPELNLQTWKQAVQDATDLSKLITQTDRPTAGGDGFGATGRFEVGTVDKFLSTAEESIRKLRAESSQEAILKKLENHKRRATPTETQAMLRLVVNTLGKAETRKIVWQESRMALAKLVDEVRKSDDQDDNPKQWVMTKLVPAVATNNEIEVSRLTSVAEQLVMLGNSKQAAIFRKRAESCQTQSPSEVLENYAKTANEFWLKELVAEVEQDLNEGRTQRALALMRSLPVEVLLATADKGSWFALNEKDPAKLIVAEDVKAYAEVMRQIISNDRANRIAEEKTDVALDTYFEQRLTSMSRVSVP
jgi:hypothetical protein